MLQEARHLSASPCGVAVALAIGTILLLLPRDSLVDAEPELTGVTWRLIGAGRIDGDDSARDGKMVGVLMVTDLLQRHLGEFVKALDDPAVAALAKVLDMTVPACFAHLADLLADKWPFLG